MQVILSFIQADIDEQHVCENAQAIEQYFERKYKKKFKVNIETLELYCEQGFDIIESKKEIQQDLKKISSLVEVKKPSKEFAPIKRKKFFGLF